MLSPNSLEEQQEETIEVFIFSYNRGKFLKNCLDTARKCLAGLSVTIIDDNSDDPEVLELLECCKENFRVLQIDRSIDARYGGLYPNMQAAITKHSSCDYLLFIQDDTQIVRPFLSEDKDYIKEYFEYFDNALFLSPSFLKGSWAGRNRMVSLDNRFPVYFVGTDANNAYFSAITIVNRERMIKKGFSLSRGEQATGSEARNDGYHKMGQMAHPFVAWLPFVPNFRGKKESLAMRLAKRFGTVGYFPFEIISDQEVDALKKRDLKTLPVMEDFLHPIGLDTIANPIWYHDPVEQHPFIKKISRYELKIQRLKRRAKALFRTET